MIEAIVVLVISAVFLSILWAENSLRKEIQELNELKEQSYHLRRIKGLLERDLNSDRRSKYIRMAMDAKTGAECKIVADEYERSLEV